MRISAVVPAYNEAKTIAGVVRPLVASGAFDGVLVVDDGSTDDTARIAHEAGASVLSLRPNRRKGGAMKAGVAATQGDAVAFFDADLIGLRVDHVEALLAPLRAGTCVQVVGLRDYGPTYNRLQTAIPPITGERVLLRSAIARVPEDFWSGFRVEMGLNAAATLERTCYVFFDGIRMVTKWEKVGLEQGLRDAVQMGSEVIDAMHAAFGSVWTPRVPVAPTTLRERVARLQAIFDAEAEEFAAHGTLTEPPALRVVWEPWLEAATCGGLPYRIAWAHPPRVEVQWQSMAASEAEIRAMVRHALGHLCAAEADLFGCADAAAAVARVTGPTLS